MPAGPFTVVNKALLRSVNGAIDMDSDTFVAVLITSAHSASPADELWSDISAAEAVGTGYTAGGQVVSPLTVSEASGVVTVDSATNPLWSSATVAAKYIYVVRRAGGSLVGGDYILGYMDLNAAGGNLSSVGSDFEVTWPTTGLFTLARAP